jgi:hypothetical protein
MGFKSWTSRKPGTKSVARGGPTGPLQNISWASASMPFGPSSIPSSTPHIMAYAQLQLISHTCLIPRFCKISSLSQPCRTAVNMKVPMPRWALVSTCTFACAGGLVNPSRHSLTCLESSDVLYSPARTAVMFCTSLALCFRIVNPQLHDAICMGPWPCHVGSSHEFPSM